MKIFLLIIFNVFRRFSSGNKSLWDETQINRVLQEYVMHHFPQNYQHVLDVVEEVCIKEEESSKGHECTSVNSIHEKILSKCINSIQKSVALLYCTWKIHNGDLVDMFISKGADVNAMDPDGRSCLHLSCCAGHPDNVEALLKKRDIKNGHYGFSLECDQR